jgi:hypothetical protein
MDDEYRFWIDRLGYIKQATRLSGGQGIVVSLCFLFALLDELGSARFTTHLLSSRSLKLMTSFMIRTLKR